MKSASYKCRILLDTNVLLEYLDRSRSKHLLVINRIRCLREKGCELLIAPQCLYELWVVLTRPRENNGYGFSPKVASAYIRQLEETFVLEQDPPQMFQTWLDLCVRYEVIGRQAHDARLVAWMKGHGVDGILTLNPSDFSRFWDVLVIPI